MVTERDKLIIIQPNRSANWQQNKWLLWVLGGWTLLTALGLGLSGAWLVIPFAGLEIAGLAFGLYYVCWKLNQRQVLTFGPELIVLERGSYYPKQRRSMPIDTTFISVERPAHHWDALKIYACDGRETIQLGDFLSKSDSELLLRSLQRRGLPTRNYSASAKQMF